MKPIVAVLLIVLPLALLLGVRDASQMNLILLRRRERGDALPWAIHN